MIKSDFSPPAECTASPWKLAHLMAIAGVHFCSVGFLMQFPRYVMALGGSAQDAGWLLALGIIPSLALAAPVGEWNRRFGGRWPAVLGGLVAALANLAMLLVHELDVWMCLLRLLYAVGQTMLFVTLFSQAAALAGQPAERARNIGWLALVLQMGNATGAALGEWAYGQSYILFWLGASGFALLAVLLSACWSHLPVAAPAPAVAADAPRGWKQWPSEVWVMLAVGMTFAGLTQFMPAFIEHLGRNGQLAEPFAAAWFITPALLVVAVVRSVGGYYAHWLLGPMVLRICHGLLLLTVLALPWISSRDHALLLAVAFGLSYGWLYPALSSLGYSRAPAHMSGKVGAWLVMAFEIGFRLSPVLLGTLITQGGYGVMFFGLAVLYCALLIVARLVGGGQK